MISGDGIVLVPEKLESVEQMPPPTKPKEVKFFLGLIGYYRKFMPKFADIARSLNALTRKDVDFEWTDISQQSIELLKNKLLEEPILQYPDPNKPYVLFTDASKYAWSFALPQEYIHVIEGKEKKVLHLIMYMSGFFKGIKFGLFNQRSLYHLYVSKETHLLFGRC